MLSGRSVYAAVVVRSAKDLEGVHLAFGCGKCRCLLALTPRVRACLLVDVEMPFSSTFSAAAGDTELLRGWKVAQKIEPLAPSSVAGRGIGSRGDVLTDVYTLAL
jgi:hypothetical protein